METKINALEPILFRCFELMKTTLALHLDKTYHSTFIVASRMGYFSEYLKGVLERVNSEFDTFQSEIYCTWTGAVALRL